MKKRILKYTIRVNKKYNEIEIFIRDYPACGCAFTCVSSEGHSTANSLYYLQNTRPATNEEISKANSKVINDFLALYSDDYELQYLKRLPR
jgi:hypothetical protein